MERSSRQNPANVQLRLSTRNFSSSQDKWQAQSALSKQSAQSFGFQEVQFGPRPDTSICKLHTSAYSIVGRKTHNGAIGLDWFSLFSGINRLLRLGARSYLIMRGVTARVCMLGMGANAGGGSQQRAAAAGGGRPPAHSHTLRERRANCVRESFCINGGAICGSARGTLAAQAIRLMLCELSDRRLKCSSALWCGYSRLAFFVSLHDSSALMQLRAKLMADWADPRWNSYNINLCDLFRPEEDLEDFLMQ